MTQVSSFLFNLCWVESKVVDMLPTNVFPQQTITTSLVLELLELGSPRFPPESYSDHSGP
jgi:hypothetical protein